MSHNTLRRTLFYFVLGILIINNNYLLAFESSANNSLEENNKLLNFGLTSA